MEKKMNVSVKLKEWYYHTAKTYLFYRMIIRDNTGIFTKKEKSEAERKVDKYRYALDMCDDVMSENQKKDFFTGAEEDARRDFLLKRKNKFSR